MSIHLNNGTRLMQAAESSLLFIDMQQKLLPAIHEGEAAQAACVWLAGVARALDVPIVLTEHCPAALGPSDAPLLEACAGAPVIEKSHFSAVADPSFRELAPHLRPQVVVGGAETHVCVLQTVVELCRRGYEVFVVAEAVGSRRASDKALGLERMTRAGAQIVSREMVAFEWLGHAGAHKFKEIMRGFIR